jgi:hypothetical protein
MTHVECVEALREEIDRIDREVVDKIAEWVQALKEMDGTDFDPLTVQILGLAHDYAMDVEAVKRVFQAMAALVEEGRTG